MFEKNNKERFKVLYKQGKISGFKILQDQETGVNYLFSFEGHAGGLTVLLDKEGKPIVTPIERDY